MHDCTVCITQEGNAFLDHLKGAFRRIWMTLPTLSSEHAPTIVLGSIDDVCSMLLNLLSVGG